MHICTLQQVARLANKVNNNPSHPCHWDYHLQCNAYTGLVQSTKKQHWIEWLENADETNIWSINCLMSGPSTDGGRTWTPPLKTTSEDNCTQLAIDNWHKTMLLFKLFFPLQGINLCQDPARRYSPPIFKYEPISDQQIAWVIAKMSPYKATGTSGLSNAVLTHCADLLTPHLCWYLPCKHIYSGQRYDWVGA